MSEFPVTKMAYHQLTASLEIVVHLSEIIKRSCRAHAEEPPPSRILTSNKGHVSGYVEPRDFSIGLNTSVHV